MHAKSQDFLKGRCGEIKGTVEKGKKLLNITDTVGV
jgi:hypothetical protein